MKPAAFDVWTGIFVPTASGAPLKARPGAAGKVCAACHVVKPAHAFYINGATGKMESYCKPCASARMKAWRERRAHAGS